MAYLTNAAGRLANTSVILHTGECNEQRNRKKMVHSHGRLKAAMKFGMDRPRARDHARCAREREEQKYRGPVKSLNNATPARPLFNARYTITIEARSIDKSTTSGIIRLAYSFA